MPTLGLDHYNLRAPRPVMAALRAFYCEVVGLTEGPRPPFESFGYWLYAGAQAVLHLSETRSGEAAPAPAGNFDHAAFACRGRAEFEARLAQQGVPYRVARVPGSGEVQIFCRDPAGNGVELNFPAAEA